MAVKSLGTAIGLAWLGVLPLPLPLPVESRENEMRWALQPYPHGHRLSTLSKCPHSVNLISVRTWEVLVKLIIDKLNHRKVCHINDFNRQECIWLRLTENPT